VDIGKVNQLDWGLQEHKITQDLGRWLRNVRRSVRYHVRQVRAAYTNRTVQISMYSLQIEAVVPQPRIYFTQTPASSYHLRTSNLLLHPILSQDRRPQIRRNITSYQRSKYKRTPPEHARTPSVLPYIVSTTRNDLPPQ